MTVTPLGPDLAAPVGDAAPLAGVRDADIFGSLVHAAGNASDALGTAQRAEDAFAAGRGDLQTMVFERARADATLSIASAAASKATQALTSILNMQV